MTQVIVLSSRSLFTEGVASRLRQQLGDVQLQTIDARQANALEQVIQAQPAALILDAGEMPLAQDCPLTQLWNALPDLKIIRLDPQRKQVQVLTSQQRPAGEARDLLDLIIPH